MARVLLGTGRLSCEQIVQVALHNYQVDLDASVVAALQKSAERGDVLTTQSEAFTASAAAPSDMFTMHQVRAIVCVRLANLMIARSRVRPAVVEFLAALLNAENDLMPKLAHAETDEQCMTTLCDVVRGGGDADMRARLAAASITPPGLTAAETSIMTVQGCPASTALAALAAYGAGTLADTADTVAALSCEATSAHTTPFAAKYHDFQRKHKGAMTVASNLRNLLHYSTTVDTSGRPGQDHAAFRCVPSIHGPSRASVTMAAAAVKEELNCSDAGPFDVGDARLAKHAGTAHPQPVLTALAALHTAVQPLAVASQQRFSEMISAAGAAKYGFPKTIVTASDTAADESAATSFTGVVALLVDEHAAVVTASGRSVAESAVVTCVVDDAGLSMHSRALAGATAVVAAVEACGSILAAECAVALQALQQRDATTLAAAVATAAAKAAAAVEREAENKARADALAAKAAAAVAEYEAACAAAEAAGEPKPKAPKGVSGAKKAKAKKEKKVKAAKVPTGLLLGVGTKQFLQFLYKATDAASRVPTTTADADMTTTERLAGLTATVPAVDSAGVQAMVARVAIALSPYSHTLRSTLDEILTTSSVLVKPKVPKGTRDAQPLQMAVRESAFAIIKRVFLCHGAVGIDTPVFERKDTLTGKYGEDSKLIYDLADQGGEMLALRYDLTVPFARYLAVHGVDTIKRYHIGKVYRRDQPAMNSGRFREFYQCDYDVAGTHPTMVADAEVLKVVVDVLLQLRIGEFKVKLNHRKLLDAMMDICGVPAAKFRSICSAVDKLDKETWETVRDEMVVQKGLDGAVADRIGVYVTMAATTGDPWPLLKQLRDNPEFAAHAGAQVAMDELELLFGFLDAMKCLPRITFDLSLARGLDYYTGTIYEAVLTAPGRSGTIAAGGRYDNLVGMFSGKQVPAVGVSIGIERILAILESDITSQQKKSKSSAQSQTEVFVGSIGDGLMSQRMTVAASLWAAGVRAEFDFHMNPKPKPQLQHVDKNGIPLLIWIAEDEYEKGIVKIKDMAAKTEVECPVADVVERVQKLLQPLRDAALAGGLLGLTEVGDAVDAVAAGDDEAKK